MSAPDRNPHRSVRLLLKVASRVFDAVTLSTVVHPALADLQHEIDEAGADRWKQILVQGRGLWTFCTLLAVAPVAAPQSPVSGRVMPTRAWSEDRPFAVLIVAFFAASLFLPLFLGWTATALAGGLLLAAGLRSWHTRHPARLADNSTGLPAEINFSAIPVGGNAGGLICMIGCAAILVAGLPGFAWFLVATLAAGVLVAAGLSSRHMTRSSGVLPRRSLLGV